MNRDIARCFLLAGGHAVSCAENGADAITAVAGADFDVVLMDVRMPGMDGLEATRRIRALGGERGRVPIVALSAQVFTEQVRKCREAGMTGHLGKPFDLEALQAAVINAAKADRVRSGSGTDQSAPAPVIAETGTELPVFDQIVFDRTAGCLAPEQVATYLQTLVDRGEALLIALRRGHGLPRAGDDLVEAVHLLAGSAGMLGFHRLAALGRRFERAVDSGAEDEATLAAGLDAAIMGMLEAIRNDVGQPVCT